MADDFYTSPPSSNGTRFRSLDDGTRHWAAGIASYVVTLGTPDVCQEVTLTTGLPVQQQTGHTFNVDVGNFPAGFLAAQSGTWNVGITNATLAVTQSGTWNVGITGPVTVTGGLTDAELRATPVPVSGTFWQATQPVSVASIPSHDVTNAGTFAVQVSSSALPTGASTAAKQPALGTAGTASADVITVQGIASMTALKVDGSAVTQPVSGTFWQATQPVSVASIPSHDVTNAGTFAVQPDSSKVAGGAYSGSPTGSFALAVRNDSLSNIVGATNVGYAPLAVDEYGRLGTRDCRLADSTSAGGVGSFILGIRNDANASRSTSDGNFSAISVDSAGRVVVTENGGSLTVDAPVAAPVFVRLSDGAAAISTLPVSLASVPSHAVTNAGTFAVQVDGAALTSLQLIDDAVATLGTTTYAETTTKGLTIGAVRRDADTTLVDTTNEIGPLQMDANGRLKVEVFSGETLPVSLTTTAVTNAGTFVVQENGAALTALQLLDDTVFTDDAAFTPASSKVLAIGMQADETSTDSVNEGDIGCPRMTLDRQVIVADYAHASAGATGYHLVVASTTNATVIKASAGTVFSISVFNTAASPRYIKFVDKATTPTAGSETVLFVLGVKGANEPNQIEFPKGLKFSTGISFFTVTGIADSNSTAVTSGDFTMDVTYK